MKTPTSLTPRDLRPSASTSLWFAAGAMCTLAVLCTYLGIVISASVVGANEDWKAVLWLVVYVLASIVAPSLLYWLAVRNRRRSLAQALLWSAGLSVLVNLLLAPIGITVLGGV